MNTKGEKSFEFSFTISASADAIFPTLLDPKQWWSGVYGEELKGESKEVGDVFTFAAGAGVHNTTQRLVELMPGKKIVWEVIESRLTFLQNAEEWKGTRFGFELEKEGEKTKVTFVHHGLVPSIECYGDCSGGWTRYLQNLKNKHTA
jgi:hypothetical protein